MDMSMIGKSPRQCSQTTLLMMTILGHGFLMISVNGLAGLMSFLILQISYQQIRPIQVCQFLMISMKMGLRMYFMIMMRNMVISIMILVNLK